MNCELCNNPIECGQEYTGTAHSSCQERLKPCKECGSLLWDLELCPRCSTQHTFTLINDGGLLSTLTGIEVKGPVSVDQLGLEYALKTAKNFWYYEHYEGVTVTLEDDVDFLFKEGKDGHVNYSQLFQKTFEQIIIPKLTQLEECRIASRFASEHDMHYLDCEMPNLKKIGVISLRGVSNKFLKNAETVDLQEDVEPEDRCKICEIIKTKELEGVTAKITFMNENK